MGTVAATITLAAIPLDATFFFFVTRVLGRLCSLSSKARAPPFHGRCPKPPPRTPFLFATNASTHASPACRKVDAFRVDGIPHLAMVNADGEVETAIIGAVPKDVSTVVSLRDCAAV